MRREIEREERLLACEEAVYLRDAAAGKASTSETRATEARAWSLVLDEVSPDKIVPATLAAIKAKPNSYPPSARDVLAAATGEEWQTGESGKLERVVCANGGAYESWDEQKARAERAATRALSEPLPALEVSVEELKARLRAPLPAPPRALDVAASHAPVAPRPPRRETCEETLLRLELMLDDSRDKRMLVWFASWHRQWHDSHAGQLMELADIENEFEAFVASKMEAKSK